jgi:osmoprotectant transport system ATP-binding protein
MDTSAYSPSGKAPRLNARAVSKRYGPTRALDEVTLEVAAGECLVLVGESGSGKTTLLRTFNRLVEVDAGTVEIEGRSLSDIDPISLRRRIGYVPQGDGLLPHWNVARNVALVPSLLKQAGLDDAARRALDLVGMDWATFAHRWPCELSGGQRQRVALARALAAGQRLLLLDEPFGALDAITRSDLQRTFQRLHRATGITVVLVTHDVHEAALLADRVAVMRAGRVEQTAAPRQLAARPATDYVHDLLVRSRFLEDAEP